MLTSVYVFIVKYFSALPPNPPAASPKVQRNNLVRWRDFIKSVPSFKAAPHNSASRFGERFFAKPRFEKRRNTGCTRKGHAASVRLLRRQRLRNISSFSNRRIGGKDPPKRADAIARCCPVIIPNVPAPDKIQCVWAVRNFLASLRSTRK